MKRIALAACLAAVVLPFALRAQTGPDFSGTWTMDPARSESAAQSVPIGPVTIVIRQNTTELTIETAQTDNRRTVTYKVDGSETATPQVTSKMRWDGAKLVTETRYLVTEGWTMTLDESRSLNPYGREMTVETTVRVEHGYTGSSKSVSESKDYDRPTKDVFTRAGS